MISHYVFVRERERDGFKLHFFKPLDLSRSNNQKNTLINANIHIKISLIIPHLLYFISILKPKKSVIFDSLTFLFLSLSPTLLFHLHG